MPFDEAPSRRMAWDADGSVLVVYQGAGNPPVGTGPQGSFVTVGSTEIGKLNDEDLDDAVRTQGASAGFNTVIQYALLFPEQREVDGFFLAATSSGQASNGSWSAESVDTTNGADGAWSDTGVSVTSIRTPHVEHRDNITSTALPSRKAIAVAMTYAPVKSGSWYSLHVYGVISPGQTPDRIIFLDTEDSDQEFTKPLDYGDIPRGQTTTRTFKIKNNSSTKTINTVQITAEDLYLNAGDWYTFGDDGVAYQATHAVGNLGPGVTELVYLKQIIPGGETLGSQDGRILVSHVSVT